MSHGSNVTPWNSSAWFIGKRADGTYFIRHKRVGHDYGEFETYLEAEDAARKIEEEARSLAKHSDFGHGSYGGTD